MIASTNDFLLGWFTGAILGLILVWVVVNRYVDKK